MKIEGYESRNITGSVELRDDGDGGTKIVGLGAVFDKLSENLGGFREVIAPGAFEKTDMDDVRGLFNHDGNYVLGRTTSDTLKLERSENGLRYAIDAPDTQTIRDLVVEPIRRKDVTGSSFGFIVGRGNDEWDENDEGVLIRTIHKIRKLFDVGPVTFPAYPDTGAGVRSMQGFLEQRETHEEVREHMRKLGVKAEHILHRAELNRISRS